MADDSRQGRADYGLVGGGEQQGEQRPGEDDAPRALVQV
jgi:hypothetical protein